MRNASTTALPYRQHLPEAIEKVVQLLLKKGADVNDPAL